MPWALLEASADVSKIVGPDITNLKAPKCHETGQIDFPGLNMYILVASKLRSFPLTPNLLVSFVISRQIRLNGELRYKKVLKHVMLSTSHII